MIILTNENYFSPETKALTNSKMGDWLKCPNYFHRKHILHTIEPVGSGAFTVGDVTDNLLTELQSTKDYAVCTLDGRTKAGKEEKAEYEAQGKIIVTKAEYELSLNLASAVQETEAYKEVLRDGYIMQDILQIPYEIGTYFDSLAGKPDFYLIKDNICTILDLKTTREVDPERYYYAAKNYGYFRQLATYSIILHSLHPEIKRFVYKHLVVSKVKDIFPVEVFEISHDAVRPEHDNIMAIIDAIDKETEFKKYNPSLSRPVLIGETFDY